MIHRQDPRRAVIRDRPRHDQALEIGKIVGQCGEVVRLAAIIELCEQRLAELRDHVGEMESLADFRAAIEHRRDLRQRIEILEHLFCDIGSLHFDHDRSSIPQQRAMDLSQRSRREGLLFECGVRFGDPDAQLLGDDALDVRVRKRRHVVLQARESFDIWRGKQIAAAREQLPQLHERRAHRFEIFGELFGLCGLSGDRVVMVHIAVPPGLGDDIRTAVFDQQETDVSVPTDVGELQGVGHGLIQARGFGPAIASVRRAKRHVSRSTRFATYCRASDR